MKELLFILYSVTPGMVLILFTIWAQKMLQVTVIETKVLLTIAAGGTILATVLVYLTV